MGYVIIWEIIGLVIGMGDNKGKYRVGDNRGNYMPMRPGQRPGRA